MNSLTGMKSHHISRISALVCIFLIFIVACTPAETDPNQVPEGIEEAEATAEATPEIGATATTADTPTPDATNTPTNTPTETSTPTPIPPTDTITPTPTLTPTMGGFISSSLNVNVREGPGTNFRAVAALRPRDDVMLLGQNPEGDWYQVRLSDGTEGWIASRLIEVEEGNAEPPVIVFGAENNETPATQALPNVDTNLTNATALALLTAAPPSQTPADQVAVVNTSEATEEAEVTEVTIAEETEDAESNATSTAVVVDNTTLEPSNLSAAETAVASGQGIDVFAFCDNPRHGLPPPSSISAGSTIEIYWSWFAVTEQQVRDHLSASQHEIRVNDDLVSQINRYATPVVNRGGSWVTDFFIPYGPLEAGEYTISYRVTWAERITDGSKAYGPGTDTPFEEESCTFTVR